MIEEPGTVISIDGPYAEVRTERRSVCGGCAANGACGTSLIERFFGRRSIHVRALNRPQAAVGERVLVGISEQGLLLASAAVYLVPMVGLVGGVLLGDGVSGSLLASRHSDVASLLGGALGFALALLWLRGYSAGSRNRRDQQAIVVSRLDRSVPVGIRPVP